MPTSREPPPAAVRVLGRVPDRVAAERLGVHHSTAARWRARLGIAPYARPGIRWDDVPDLGRVPDRVIAERLGCATIAVSGARARRGIWRSHHAAATAWDDVPDLGVLPDSVLAALRGACISAVAGARRRRGQIAATFVSATVPITVPLAAALRKMHPGVDLHVAAFLVLAHATGAHVIDR